MRVKRYVAETLQDAMLKVKMDMGRDAVILHTRKFKEGGLFGLFGKVKFEVTAALEDVQSSVASSEPPNLKQAQNLAQAKEKDKTDEIRQELQAVKSMLNELMIQRENTGAKEFPEPLRKYYDILSDNEVEYFLIDRILRDVLKLLPEEDINDSEKVKKTLGEQIEKMLKYPQPISFKEQDSKQQVIALIGPTGVGKTTTIAKLAATFSIVDKKKVALITADTYRVAAVEQLKTYGEIIGVPVDVVYTPQELDEALSRHNDKELVLIDTAGRSHKNTEQMSELHSFLDFAKPSEIFLVLSVTTRSKDMMDIIEGYSRIPVSRFVFTKLDETTAYGPILNVVYKTQKSLSYVTVGQSVPDDIEVADPTNIAKLILRER